MLRVSSRYMTWCCVLLFCVSVCDVAAKDYTSFVASEGESCDEDGKTGELKRLGYCRVLRDLHNNSIWKTVTIYSFVGYEPVVCCIPTAATATTAATTTTTTTTTQTPVATTPPMGSTTTEYTPQEYIYDLNKAAEPTKPTASNRTGSKSWDKCLEYQEQLIYPWEASKSLMGGWVRGNNCNHKADALIVGGENANINEFPHMVRLGYDYAEELLCGGTLISDRFVVTAAHCTCTTRRRRRYNVTYIIVGSLRRTDDRSSRSGLQAHRIRRTIKHPEFNPWTQHNDIALLQTFTPIQLGESAVPACLDVFGGGRERVFATGWGHTSYMGDLADTLQKVILEKFRDDECRSNYIDNRHHATFNSTTQVCYGDRDHRSDTCQGDSGGPLVITNQNITCMYTVVGITSFGKGCGTAGLPGWYTRVAHFVPWIESVVWP